MLVLAQTAILGAGAVAVFHYATRRLGPDGTRPAAAFALLYLVNPSLHGINIRDIHPQAFAIASVVWAAAAFDARRYAWCALALVLTLGGREDAAIASDAPAQTSSGVTLCMPSGIGLILAIFALLG